jgi:hypothetical protein
MNSGRLRLLIGACAALLAAVVVEAAEWTDAQGNRLRGEPTEILGPFALFRTHLRGGQRVLLRGLSTEVCERLYRELARRPPPAAHWSDARGAATAPLPGHAFQLVNRHLEPVDFTTLPEPELLLVVAGANNAESWPMVDNLRPLHRRLQRVLHGRCATVFVGTPQPQEMYNQFVVAAAMPWLIADHRALPALGPISSFIPPEGTLLLLLSREGTPLLSAVASDFGAIRKFTDDVLALLWAINPDNPRMWPDLAHYARAVRPLKFAQSSTGPLLIGEPLQPEALRRRGVQRVAARFEVGADGVPTVVNLDPAVPLPAKLTAALPEALRRHAVFVPAIAKGAPVAGSYEYDLRIPPEDPLAAADAAWLGGPARVELPVPAWLVLKPIHVPEADFGGEIDHVDTSGKVILKSLEVTEGRISRQAQLSAFHTDWFAAAGAATVHPVEGQVQPVDNDRPVWRRIVPVDGLVDFATGMGNCDYCVGYAWTEIDVPANLEAWLGIGSDDGLKIWHNGELVVDRWIRRPSRIDEDIVPLRLKKGKNQLLVKIQNVTIQWSFICRLRVREP